MSENKLLTRLKNYLDLSAKRRKKKVDELERVISKIRKKEKKLLIKYRNAGKAGKDKKRKMLGQRIIILNVHRKKGQKALKKIK